MKETMRQYFERFFDMWKGFNGTYPQISYDPDIDNRLYIGKMDEEEYISWKPMEKDVPTDLTAMEEKYNVKFNKDIAEYFNTYWFLELMGFCGEHNVSLVPVTPSEETKEFERGIRDYYEAIGSLEFVPVGFDATTYSLVVVENASGKVFFHNTETGENTFFFNSLKEMIGNISFKK